MFDILSIAKSIGKETCRILLSAHALTGCDTTSNPFGFRKGKSFINSSFKEYSVMFLDPESNKEQLTLPGEKAMILFYGGHSNENALDCNSSTSAVQPEDIPPPYIGRM